MFRIFNLKGIVCDKNGDGIIIKEELQCLNYIWKYYVPADNNDDSSVNINANVNVNPNVNVNVGI